ncbi:MAG: uracil-DNA glycosylase [Burkholderiales bacterium]|nr:uracil-DNA glycosylase [Burkholderiales bacterium]
MSWTDRQLALLREMGLTLWWPGAAPRGAEGRRRAARRDEAVAAGPRDDAAAHPAGDDAGGRPADRPTDAAADPAADPAAAGPAGGPAGSAATRPAGSPLPAAHPAADTSAGDHATAPAMSAAGPPAAFSPQRGAAPISASAPTGTRPAGIGQMDWPALRQAVAGCTACDLCRSRTQTVFGVGNERAHWMIVGEAPGEQEDLRGEPFVGRSGQLLDRMLAAVGLTRADAPPEQQVFIANTLKCRPPGNRNPQPAEMAQCEPYLLRQIELIQPRIILAMGRFAAQSLLRSDQPIGRLRGQVHTYHGVPLIVTYHPAYLLRSPADKALAWSDLCLARATLAEQAAAAS